MFDSKIQKLFIFGVVALCCSISFHYVSANDPKIINISKNYQSFIDFTKYPSIKALYNSGDIIFNILPSESVKLIVKEDVLVFWLKPGIIKEEVTLEVVVKNKTYSVPIIASNDKNPLDFDITGDMYGLSLQEKSLSCESSATADIVERFFAKDVDEDIIIDLLPKGAYFNTLPEEHPGDVMIWGNPHLGFVGYIDSTNEVNAKQKLMTGYGVYEDPISDVYQDLGFQTEIFNITRHTKDITPELHLQYLLKKLELGFMVQLWGDWCTTLEYDDGVLENKSLIATLEPGEFISAKNSCYNVDQDRDLDWKYYNNQGELVNHTGLDGQHAFILLGWKGDISSPSHIRVWDTDTGYHLYPTVEWMRKWEAMDYRSIIITQ